MQSGRRRASGSLRHSRIGLQDAEFNGSFVLQCITCQYQRDIALGPPTIPLLNCNLCGGRSNCTMRQKSGVVFVNLFDRVNHIVRCTLQLRLRFTVLIVLSDSLAIWPSLFHSQAYCILLALQQLRAPIESKHDQTKRCHGGARIYCNGEIGALLCLKIILRLLTACWPGICRCLDRHERYHVRHRRCWPGVQQGAPGCH